MMDQAMKGKPLFLLMTDLCNLGDPEFCADFFGPSQACSKCRCSATFGQGVGTRPPYRSASPEAGGISARPEASRCACHFDVLSNP